MRRVSFNGLIKAAAAVTVVFSLATFADAMHRYLELFSHFRLQYFFVALLLALVLALMRARWWAVTLMLVTLINAAPLAPWYFTGTKTAPPSNPTLTILQANVYGGNHRTQRLLDLIETEQPDVIFLQEVTDTWVAAMDQVADRYPYAHAIPRHDNFGIAVYSRQPWLNIEVIESPPRALPSLLLRLPFHNTVASFVTTHPVPPIGADWYKARNQQLESIAELMASLDGPKVLVGDLNISMWAHHYEPLVATTGLRNARYGFGILPTWPKNLPIAAIPIDHCLISDEFAVQDIRVGDSIGSDHLPMIIELALFSVGPEGPPTD